MSASVRKADDQQAGGQFSFGPMLSKKSAINGHSHFAYVPAMHQQDGPLDATERIFGTTAENELAEPPSTVSTHHNQVASRSLATRATASGWILPPLMIRPFGAPCQQRTFAGGVRASCCCAYVDKHADLLGCLNFWPTYVTVPIALKLWYFSR